MDFVDVCKVVLMSRLFRHCAHQGIWIGAAPLLDFLHLVLHAYSCRYAP